jgi:hypothetical protein
VGELPHAKNFKGVVTKGKKKRGRKHKRKRQEASEADGLRQRQGSEAETESGIWRQTEIWMGTGDKVFSMSLWSRAPPNFCTESEEE